ncbi:LIM domain only protein 7b isoform X6 [Micropterus dolomieu]|uniref:LIM domain only protein 7b isoform X6 n=1 Tax=Micropterus dolomieu TaxID=147949 RepID=UPI001E8CF31D|nr:LIM domain only protein 7b isoform X6 [Micropterus dolomieu]
MEWRQQTSVSCEDAFSEAQRWIEEVTGKSFGCNDFRAALENGVLLCDLINKLKPGIIKRVNRLSTPIAGLDNVSVFLKACSKLGLNVSQLFHPGDLQDLSTRATLRRDESNRRLKNVLITIYWLGRKAHLDTFYSGPLLNFKAFEGLLGLALSKSLDEGSNVCVKDSSYGEGCYPERDECQSRGLSYKMANTGHSMDSLDSRALRSNSEGCGSDAEAEQVFKMESMQPATQQNKGYIPPPLLRRKQGRNENGQGCASPLPRAYQIQVRPERPVQVNPGWIWSKSLSDIPMVYPVRKVPDGNTNYDVGQDAGMAQEWNQENKRRCSVAPKDSEAQWQDDLTKWKNRRRSTKSDLRRKSQDREHVITKMINGAVTNFEKNEAGGLLKRDQQSPRRHNPAPRPYSTSPPSKSTSSDLRPRTRALLARSYATEAPFSPTTPLSPHIPAHSQGLSVGVKPASDGNILGEETHLASLASDGAGVATPSLDYPFSSQTQVKAQISSLITTVQPNETKKSATTSDPTASMSSHKELPFCIDQAGDDALEEHQNHKSQEESQKTSWKPAVEQGRGQQASGYKYLSRTGSWSGSASLPRGYRRSEGSSRLSAAITARPFGTKQFRVSSLPRLCNVDDNQGLLLKSDKEESLSPFPESKQNGTEQGEEVKGATLSSQTSLQINGCHQPYTQTQLLPQPYSNQQAHHNKSSTFTSDASIDRPKVDHSDMRVSLTLKPSSRLDFGFQTRWGSAGVTVKSIQPGSPAELCQLRVDDEIVAVNGVAVAHMNYSQWKDKITSSLQTGSLTMDIRRYGNKGGSESAISDLQVPSLSPSSSSWSWDREEDRRRQEKWQEEQERLLQEQYQRDQERLEAEWQRAQQDAVGELCRKSVQNTSVLTNGGEGPASTQFHVNGLINKTRAKEQRPDRDELKEVGLKSESNAQGVQNDKISEQAWAEDSCGFARLSPTHRAKSLSTPALAGPHKQIRGDERRKGQSVSKVEHERQQILEEMKKRTQLLTDNSWIRQRSSSFYKEPIYAGVPLKRHESLDDLDTLRQSPTLTAPFSYPRPHSAAAGYCAPSRNSSSRYSTGSILSQRNTSMDSHQGGMVSGRRTCCVCERALGSGAAMVIEALSLCFHLACFQCVGCHRRLGGTETGVQVQIRKRKPYCEPCYFQLKSSGAPPM